MAKKKRDRKFIQKARARMEAKGTVGAFGKATPKKIARAKAHGGIEKKQAVFATNMKKIAAKRKKKRRNKRRSSGRS